MAHWLDKVVEILQAKTDDLRELADIAGYSPVTFYRGTRMDGADLSGQDLAGMEFTDLDLFKVRHDEDTRLARPSIPQPDLAGYFAYSRSDDENLHHELTRLRELISAELRLQLGRDVRLWPDTERAIPPDRFLESERLLAESAFFIPIMSPSAIDNPYFQAEVYAFLDRESELGRSDLVFPILYSPLPGFQSADRPNGNRLLNMLHSRQYADWTEIRVHDTALPAVKEAVTRFCSDIVHALRTPFESPKLRRMEDTEDRERSEYLKRVFRQLS